MDSLNPTRFGSNLGRLGSGRGSNGRDAPIGFIWADFQLKRSHGDPFRDQNRVFVRPFHLGSSSELGNLPSGFRTALDQRSVPWGSHLFDFCFEQSPGDLFRDKSVPHFELTLFLRSAFFLFYMFS